MGEDPGSEPWHEATDTRGIDVLDAQQELAPVLARKRPAEERRPRASDVEVAGWGRGKYGRIDWTAGL